jgi:aryl-alcohol dehydrogenase-like predicted oxidoreductase
MTFQPRLLGRTGLRVGPLGVGSSYGVPAAAIEMAFEQGVNYLYWGSLRRGGFAEALRNLKPQRNKVVLVMQSYSRLAPLVGWSVEHGLRRLGYDFADILLLGLWNKPVPAGILDAARRLRERGLVRHLAISAHHRPRIAELGQGSDFDVLHFRYNAAHPGAEREIFPALPAAGGPGMVSFTATCWGKLLRSDRIPRGERTPTAADCYQFVLSRPEVHVCLSGPADRGQMEEALRALRGGPMSADELAWMLRVGAAVHG